MKKNKFPVGWDEQKINGVIAHHEGEIKEQATLEHEAALKNQTETVMEVKGELIPVVRELKKEVIK